MLLDDGGEVSPRGHLTKELINVNLVLLNLTENVIVNPTRDLNYRFMVAEWVWMMFGLDVVAPLARYNKEMLKFSDDGVTLAGAYGPRLLGQDQYVLRTLRADPDSRQAVVTIWDPSPPPSKDIPCTVALQFLLRLGELHCVATMRSSDAWLGLPYDLFCFSQITNLLAGLLGVGRGTLSLNLGSGHLYEENWSHAQRAVKDGTPTVRTVCSPPLDSPPPWALRQLLITGECEEVIEPPWTRYALALSLPTKARSLAALEAPQ